MRKTFIKESANGYQEISFDASLAESRQIFLNSEINDDSAVEIIMQLRYLDKVAPGKPIEINIMSPGGSVTAGMAIYDTIRNLTSPVTIMISGMVASMAAVLSLAVPKERRLMHNHAKLLFHQPRYSNANFGGLIPGELQKHVDSLEETSQTLLEIISERTGIPLEEIKEYTQTDWILSAEEASSKGIIGEIISYKGVN